MGYILISLNSHADTKVVLRMATVDRIAPMNSDNMFHN